MGGAIYPIVTGVFQRQRQTLLNTVKIWKIRSTVSTVLLFRSTVCNFHTVLSLSTVKRAKFVPPISPNYTITLSNNINNLFAAYSIFNEQKIHKQVKIEFTKNS